MAVRRSQNWVNQQRADIPHLRSIESAVRNDFDELINTFAIGGSASYVLRGFELNMSGAIGSASSSLQMIVANSALFHGTSNESGSFFQVPTGTANETLNPTTNTRVSGSFTPSSINYVGLEFTRAVDNSTSAQVFLWNPISKTEFSKTIPLAITFDYRIIVTSSIWAANVLPIAIVETDGSNNVTSVEDRRPMLFRLGTAGSSTPNPFNTYPWTNHTEGRTENFWKSTTSTSPFRGGDKQLLHFKDWADAIMSNLLELKGTTYWYSDNVGGSITKLKSDVALLYMTGAGKFIHHEINAGQINWDNDVFLDLVGSRLSYKLDANVADLTDVNQTTNNETVSVTTTNNWISQGFTPSVSADISKVTLNLANGAAADGDLVVEIYSDNAGEPNSLLGTSKAIDASSIGVSSADYVFEFNTAVALTAATTYHIVLNTSSMGVIDGTNSIDVSRANSDVLGGVTSHTTIDGGSNWVDTSKDLVFKIELNTGTDLILADNEVAYINIVRGVDIVPNLIFTNSSAIVTSVGAQSWTGDVIVGDFIKVASELDTKYYEIQSIDSTSQVTLTEVFADTSTGAAGIEAKYAFGSYQVVTTPSTNRHVQKDAREDVPFNEDTYWLFLRQDNSGSVPRVYIRNQGELEKGEDLTIGDGVGEELLTYIGASSETDSTPDYSAINASNGSLSEQNYNTSNGESLTARLAKVTSMLADIRQDINITIDAGDITWDGTNITVSNARLSIPGTTIGAAPVSINTLASTALAANSCLYVDISRSNGGALTLTTATLASLTPSQQRLVIARNIGGELLVV